MLCFEVVENHLQRFHDACDSRHNINAAPGMNLENILKKFSMTHGMRPTLAYIIAKAVWHFYDSNWMITGWTAQNIYFMEESLGDKDNTVAYFCKPYLSTAHLSSNTAGEYHAEAGMMHRYHRVLALGILLLDIATGQSLADQEPLSHWNAKTTNKNLQALKKRLETCTFEHDCDYPRFKEAVRNCLDPKLFRNARFNPKQPSECLDERLTIIYDEIVQPLKRLVEGTGLSEEYHIMERKPLAPVTAKLILHQNSMKSDTPGAISLHKSPFQGVSHELGTCLKG